MDNNVLPKANQRKIYLIAILPLLGVILFILSMGWWQLSKNGEPEPGSAAYDQPTRELSLAELQALPPATDVKINNANQLVINGELKANQAFIITPGTEPENPQAGQLYFDQASSRLRYYEGSTFVDLAFELEGQSICYVGNDCGFLTPADLPAGLTLPQPLGVTSSPTFANITITNDVSVASGGTGRSSFTNNAVLLGNGGGDLDVTNAPASGQILIANAAGVPTFVGISGLVTINSSGVTQLSDTGVTPGTYGDGSSYPTFTVDADGRITAVSTESSGGGGTVTALNGLTGSLTINGTTDQIIVTDNTTDTVTLSLPQAIATTSSPSFAGLNLSANLTVNGSTTLGDSLADTISINGTLQGGTPLVFEGAAADGFELNLDIAALTADRTITLPNADGTVCLTSGNCVGAIGGSAPSDALYLTLATDADLSNERILTPGTNLSAVDGGAGGNLTLNVAANPTFSGLVTLNGGLTIETGDTFTFNGDSFDDLTGTGLTIAGGDLQTTLGTTVDLLSEVINVLPVANGGTGAATLTAGGILLGNDDSAITATGVLANGQLLIGDGSGAPALATLSQGSGISIANGPGSITISSTLGTSVDTLEVVDNTLLGIDLYYTNATLGAGEDNYILSYDNASGGFTWVDPATAGSSQDLFATINAPNGSDPVADNAADILNLADGTNILISGDSGTDTITLGVVNNPTFSGLVTLNGGLTIETGDTFTFNGDSFDDLTGTGLTIAGGDLQTTLGTTIEGSEITDLTVDTGDLANDAVTLGTKTSGNYVATITNGSGISGSSSSEGGTPTIALGNLTANWQQSGAFDIVLDNASSELRILESVGSTFYATFDVGNLGNDTTVSIPDAVGASDTFCLVTLANCAGTAQNVFQTVATPAGTSPAADSSTDTLTLANGSGITITGDSGTDTVTIAATLGTTVDGSELVDGSIEEVDLEVTNAAVDNYVLTYDSASGGFTWVDGATLGVDTDTFAVVEVDGVAQSTGAPTLDFSSADFLLSESPADSFDITIQAERIQDLSGAMVSGNTETGIAVTYQDSDGTIDFVVDNLENLAGTLDIASGGTGAGTLNDLITLGTHTTGNYVATITNGSGISGSSSTEGGTPTIALGNLTANWQQSGAFDIVLDNASSELQIRGSGGAFYATLDAGALAGNETFNLAPGTAGDICTSAGNCVGSSGGSAPDDAQYLTLALSGNLSAERVLTPGSSLSISDGGANGNYSINTIQDIRTTASPTFASPTFTGTLAVQGASVTVGGSSQLGQLILNDGTSNTATIALANFNGNYVLTIPNTGGADTFCLESLANCAGAAQDVFTTIDVTGGSDPTADNSTDTLVLADGSNITISGDSGTDTITVAVVASPTFTNLTVNGNTVIGSDDADVITLNGVIQGATPFIFEGSSANSFETFFAITDPTGDRTITFPDTSGEVSLLGQTIEDAEVSDSITVGAGGSVNDGALSANVSLLGQTIESAEITNGTIQGEDIGDDEIALGTKTSGNYVATISSGSGISGSSSSEGGTPTIALGNLTADWIQGGGFDIVLDHSGSELRILESTGGTFYGSIDVGDLSGDRAYTFPDATGEVCLSSGNCIGGGGGGAPSDAQYLTLAFDGDLSAERVLQPGSGIGLSDGGANGNATLSLGALTANWQQTGAFDIVLDNASSELRMLESTGGTFYATLDTGDLSANVTYQLPDASAGTYDICTTAGNCIGGGGGAPNTPSYLTLGLDSNLTSERVLVAGDGLSSSDGGANGNLTLNVDTDGTTLGLNGSDELYVLDSGITSLQIDDGTIQGEDIGDDEIALGTKTSGNYVATISSGSGISGSSSSEGGTPTIALGNLTANWQQSGAFDIVLDNASSELRILESVGSTFYATFDVGNLGNDTTVSIPDAVGASDTFCLVTLANCAGTAQNVFQTVATPAGTSPAADSSTDTLTLANGSGITITGDSSTDTVTIAATLGTTVDGSELVDGSIEEVDLEVTNAPVDNYVLTYDSASGGFSWVDGASLGTDTDTFAVIQLDGVTQSSGAPTLDFSSADFLLSESPADTFNITIQAERVQDITGAMFSGNTETGISATYQDSDGTIDLVANLEDLDGTLDIASGGTGAGTLNDLITLGTHTTGNYVATISSGSGISGSSSSEGGTPTISLGPLTANWSQTGAFDIVLNNASSELQILESTGGTFYATFDVGDLSNNTTVSIPGAAGATDTFCLVTLANCAGGSMSSFTLAGTSGTPQTIANSDTLTIAAGTNISTTAGATDTVTVAVVNNPTFSGLVTGQAGLSVTGAAINLNASSSFAVNIGTGTSTGAVTIGGGSNTFALNSTALDVSTAGVISGATGFTSTGSVTLSGAEIQGANPLVFEGSSADGNETTFAITNPTTDNTITFPNASGEVSLLGQTIEGSEITDDTVVLTTDTSGNYVATISSGSGISGSSSSEGGTPTISLGPLTANWSQTGAFDIVLNNASSELQILESTGGTFYATFDVGDLSNNTTVSIPGAAGATDTFCLVTLANCAGGSMSSFTLAGTSGTPQTIANSDTLTIAAGTNISTTAGATDTVTVAVVNNPTFSGLVTGQAGLSVTGAAINLNASSSFAVNIGTGTSTGAVTIGGGSNTFALNSTALDVSTAGVISGATGFTSTGSVTLSGAEIQGANPLVFEGSSADGNETTFAITNPTTDNTITFPNASGEVSLLGQTIEGSEITDDTVVLTTDTSGNYVATISSGSGISGSSSSEGGTPTISLGPLTANWSQTGAFDIVLNNASSELQILESTGGTFYATFDVGDLSNNTTVSIPGAAGATDTFCLVTLANCAGGSMSSFTLAGTSGTPQTIANSDTLTIAAGTNISTTAGATDTVTVAVVNNPTFSGLVTGQAGLSVTGAAINLNASSSFAVNIGTGTSTGAVTIGGGSNTFALNSTALDVSTAGVISGATGFTSTGSVTLSGAEIQGANPLVFEGSSADGNETTFAITNPTTDNTITFPNASGEVSLLGQTIEGSEITDDTVVLTTDTSGNYVATISSGSGISGSSSSEGGTPTISLGPLTANWSQTGAFDIVLNNASSELQILESTGGTFYATFDVGDLSNNTTVSIPGAAGATDTFCLVTLANCAGGSMSSFTLAGTSGTPQTIANSDTLTIAAGTNISTTAGATDTVTVAVVNNPTFSGLVTGQAGLSVTGAAINLNASSSFAVNIGTGTSTGAVTIGGGSNTFALNSTALDVSTAGVISGATGFTSTGSVTLSGAEIQGANPLVFEGSSADGNETTFAITNPTTDNTITFPNASGEVSLLGQTIEGSEITDDTVVLTTDTSGNYVATISSGSGISGSSSSEGGTPTISLGPLTANWSQTGAFDIVLNNAASELQILESSGGTFYATFDVGDLANNTTVSIPGAAGATDTFCLESLANCAGSAQNLFQTINATNGSDPVADSATDTLNVSDGSGVSVTGDSVTDTITLALGALTTNWNQTGAFDIVLDNASSELQILESSGGAFYGTLDVADLSADRTYSLPDVSGDLSVLGQTIEGSEITNDTVVLTTDTSGNYVATLTTGLGLSGSSATEGGTPTIAFDYTATLGGNPALNAGEAIFGTTGLLFEGSTANTFETLLTITNPTADRTITFPDVSGEVSVLGQTIESSEITDLTVATGDIADDAVTLGTKTAGNYVATISNGNGISGSSATEGGTPTIALGNLTANWNQTGAFDIVLNNAASELQILESSGGTFYATFDVGDLANNTTVSIPGAAGATDTFCLESLANCAGSAQNLFQTINATNGSDPVADSATDTLNVSDGSGVSVTGDSVTDTITLALGALTTNWNQTGAFDIVLNNANSELQILESTGGTFFGSLDVTDLSANRTYTLPDASGEVSVLGQTIEGSEITNDTVVLTTDTSGNYVSNVSAGTGIAITGSAAEGWTPTVALQYTATLGGNPALNGGESIFGTTGLIFEGSGADTNETLLTVINPTADRTITIPDASGEVSLLGQTIEDAEVSDTITVGASGSVNDAALSSNVSLLGQTIEGSEITNDTVVLTTDTAGNYVATISNGNGISGSSSSEGGTPTISLGPLTANWSQTGAFDIVLNNASSELQILESTGGTFYATFDVGDLSNNTTVSIPGAAGATDTFCLVTLANCAGGSMSSFTLAGTSGTPQTIANSDTLTIAAGTNISTTAGATDTVTVAVVNNPTFSGLVTGQAGLSVTGAAINLNASSSFAVNIGTGTSTGAVTIGGGSNTFALNSTALDVSTAGVISGATGFTSTGSVTLSGAEIQGANPLVFEGSSADGNETTFAITNPTTDNTITFPNASGEVSLLGQTIEGSEITDDTVVLTTDTSGNYVATISSGSGISGSSSSEGGTPTISLGPLTANWSQTGAFDIVLNNASSELQILESTGGTFYATFDVGDLSNNTTVSIPGAAGATDTFCLVTLANCAGGSMSSFTLAGTSGTPQTIANSDTLTIAAGTNISTTAGATDTVTVAVVNNPTFSGLVTGQAGLSVTGAAINLNASSSFAVNIGTGTSTGAVTIGGGSNTFALNSTALDVSTAGVISGATGFTSTGSVTLSGAEIQGANPLVFEGSSADGNETTFAITNPTTDNTITFPNASGEVSLLGQTIEGSEITDDTVVLTTDTSGNYVATISSGSGISGSSSSEGGTPTISLGPLTANWSQTGAFDIVLNNASSELQILESTGGTFYATFDVGDLSNNTTVSIPGAAGATDTFCLVTLANCAGSSTTLQGTYDADANGSDAIIALTTADDSLIFRNPASSGTDSGYVVSVDQLATGAVDGLRVANAGTGVGQSISLTNTSGTQTAGLSITRSGAGGTTTSLLSLVQSGGTATNGILFTGTIGTDITTAAARALTIESGTTGGITLGGDSSNETINLGTGSAVKAVTIGSTNSTSSTTINSGTGNIDIGTTAQARTINLGTAAAVQTVTLGSTNSTSSTTINSGTGAINIGTTAQARSINVGTGAAAQAVTLGSSNGASSTLIQSGSGDITLTSGDQIILTGFNCSGNANGGALTANASGVLSCSDDDGGSGSSDTPYILVAADDSSATAKAMADYVADGTSDETEINSALTAGAGGKVVLAEGTFIVDGTILIPNNTTLEGYGPGTIIELDDIDATDNMIENSDTSTGTGVVIRNLTLDGRDDLNTSGTQNGVYLEGMGDGLDASGRTGGNITNLWVNNFSGAAIYLYGSDNNTISDNATKDNSYGIRLDNVSMRNVVTSSSSQGDFMGIYLTGGTTNNITSNKIQGASYGILLDGTTTGSTITGNSLVENSFAGIAITDASNRNSVSGNNVRGSASTAYGIYLDDTYENNIAGNKVHESGGGAHNNGIYLTSADRNSIVGNDITDVTGCFTTCYAINISDSASDNNYLADNTFVGAVAGVSINNAGTGTIFGNQLNGSLSQATSDLILQARDDVNILSQLNVEQGTITVGTASTLGNLVIYDGSSNTVTISTEALGGNYTVSFPTEMAANDTFCLETLGNCGGGGPTTLQQAYDADANGSDAVITLTSTDGAVVVRDASSTIGNLFVVEANNGEDYLTVTTTTANQVRIGAGTDDVVLVLDSAASDPGGSIPNGAMYYDSSGNRFRCRINGSWANCDTTGGGGGPATRTITLTPQYDGAVLSADGSNNSGTMTAEAVSSLSGADGLWHNFYNWTTANGSSQDYDIVVDYQLPSEFNSSNEFSGNWTIWTHSSAIANTAATITIQNNDGGSICTATSAADIEPNADNDWQQISITNPSSGCSFSADEKVRITIKLTSVSGANIRVGEIVFAFDT